MAQESSAKELSNLLREVYLRFHRRVRVEAYRPSRESLAILQHLERSGPLTISEAARHFDRSQSAVSEIVSRLERRNLIERIPDERDRRRTLVWLTAVGRTTLEENQQVYSTRLLDDALSQLTREQQQGLTAGLLDLLATRKHEKGWD